MPPPLALEAHGTGEPIALVHGFTQTKASWARLLPILARCCPPPTRFVTVDLPGHGASAAVGVEDLAGAAALLGESVGRASYVGYSLGGRTCLTLALERPELVERLVLIGATAGIEDEQERAKRRAQDDGLAAQIDAGGDGQVEEFLRRWIAGPLFARLSPEQADLEARSRDAGGLAASLRSCGTGTQPPSWDRLSQLDMPVLVCAGAEDLRFSALARRLATAIGPNARTAIVPGAGHAACFERPEAFAHALAQFFATTRQER